MTATVHASLEPFCPASSHSNNFLWIPQRCTTEPQIELDLDPEESAAYSKDPAHPPSLQSWFRLRTQWPERAEQGPNAAPEPPADPASHDS